MHSGWQWDFSLLWRRILIRTYVSTSADLRIEPTLPDQMVDNIPYTDYLMVYITQAHQSLNQSLSEYCWDLKNGIAYHIFCSHHYMDLLKAEMIDIHPQDYVMDHVGVMAPTYSSSLTGKPFLDHSFSTSLIPLPVLIIHYLLLLSFYPHVCVLKPSSVCDNVPAVHWYFG